MSVRKQVRMFGDARDAEAAKKYTAKIEAPIYERKGQRPHILTLCDPTVTRELIREINASGLPEDEKEFLRRAAQRHTVFHYERIAEWYAWASDEAKALARNSALVIVDFEEAIERGFVMLDDAIRAQYFEEHPEAAEAHVERRVEKLYLDALAEFDGDEEMARFVAEQRAGADR